MRFFKRYELHTLTLLVFMLFLTFSFIYSDYIKVAEEKILLSKYKETAKDIRERVNTLLRLKGKSTLAIALSLASNDKFQEYILKREIPEKYYHDLIDKYRKNTLYKNIWIQVMDANGISLYRSWTKKSGDSLSQIRREVTLLKKDVKATYALSVGRYDFSIKAMAPIFYNEKLIGFVEIISHFNSIAKILENEKIDSVVLAKREQSKHLTHSLTKMFLDDYYIANYNAPQNLQKLLLKYGVENFFDREYCIKENYLIVDYPLKDIEGKTIGYYLTFKSLSSIENKDLQYFQFKWIMFFLLFILSLAAIINIILFYRMKNQKIYYKRIIDSSYNMILVRDKRSILEVNSAFFKYFPQYKSLEEFQKAHPCICDFFLKKDGYIEAGNERYTWLDRVLDSKENINKVKMKIDEKEYYFLVNVAVISEEKKHYSIILSDITKEEIYKNQLEEQIITDPLTGIKNRRFYEMKVASEIARVKRYNEPLSMIMFDIDHFKYVNDSYGHDVGDKVLIAYTKFISSIIRDADTLCRIGGEEFIIITPHTTLIEAYELAEKIRKAVEEFKAVVPITMSFGVTQYHTGEEKDPFFKRVDEALYEAKESGRNRVIKR